MRYRDAGVDVRRSDAMKRDLFADVTSTWTPAVRRLVGGFAGVMSWPGGAGRLVAATMDGVGTKLHLARAAGRLADASADLVYHGADDLLVHGARPVAFLDYIAQARLDPGVVAEVVRGLARACRETGAALLGGETAEMPDTYLPDVVDVAGCMIGVADPDRLLDGSRIRPGDALLGLGSEGLHTNGYSLARRVLRESGLSLDAPLPGGGGESLADALLAPHRWYGPALEPEFAPESVEESVDPRLHALAHVTGGGIAGNLVRVLPEGCRARVRPPEPRPALFGWLCDAGAVPEDEARDTFNLGVGMICVCAREQAARLRSDLEARGETVVALGEVVAGACGVEWSS